VSRRPAFLPVKPRTIGTPKAAVAEMYRQAGGVERVMVRIGVGKSVAYAFTDEREKDEISFARVAALTGPTVPAGAEYLALLAGGVFLPIVPEHANLNKICADDARSHGEAIAAVLADLHAGKLKHAGAAIALAKIDDALRAITALRAVVDEEVKRPPE
jgi:hypothetical protein